MTLILTNDDGIDAPGLEALRQALRHQPERVTIVAPSENCSNCGHQVTAHQPIVVEKRSPTEYAVGGMPADCTRLALSHLCPQVRWVISGINAGGNMGVDLYSSGTVAAVREAAFHGIPGIAISQYRHRQKAIDWEAATRWSAAIIADLMDRSLEPYSFWNVNLPHREPGLSEPDVVFCQLSHHPLPMNYRREGDCFHYIGNYQQRHRTPGTDVDVCFSGNIAVTQVRVG
jgi:5'-nucleotidase